MPPIRPGIPVARLGLAKPAFNETAVCSDSEERRMWVITGPFDGEVSNEVGFQKSKLLKSGKSYVISRKPQSDLVVNHKKVSHDHGQLVVAEFSPDDVTNTDYSPTLRILNSKNKTMRILREGVPNGVIVNPGATELLQHNDQVDIVSGLPLTVQWKRICCFETHENVKSPIPIDACASLGVHVVRAPHPDITYHLVPSYALTPVHMTSLLSAAHLVKPEWLTELLTLSDLDPHESPRALEYTFALPPESKFRPSFAAALPPALQTFKTWEPNETRLNMLKGYRFVFVGEKGLEIPAGYRDLVKRGGAEYEAFTVNVGAVRWRKALLRAKALAEERNGKVVPVADGGAIELVVGAEEWEKIDSVAKSLELEFIQPVSILRAVASVDTFFVDSARTTDSQGQGLQETLLPDVVPNTLSGEPSIAPPIDRPHPPRPTSSVAASFASGRPPPAAAPLSEPPAPEPEIPVVPPRRFPPRRAMARNRTASPGPANGAIIVDASPSPLPRLVPPAGDAALGATQLPTPISQTRRLPPPRRANMGIDASSALISSSSNGQVPQSQFSQLDKYKALFDASNPDRVPSIDTQPRSAASTDGVRTSMLSPVREEEQESQTQSASLRGTKRSRGADDGADVEMADNTTAAAGASVNTLEGAHRAKRRALDTNTVPQPTPGDPIPTPQPRSTQSQKQGTGSAVTVAAGATGTKRAAARPPLSQSSRDNKLDTDENFLRAVNSTKRGKKREDEFDREFNQLRITKPKKTEGLDSTATATAHATGASEAVAVAPWDAIDDFGDVGIRGNFMVVVEMDIERGGNAKPVPPARINDDGTRPEWIVRPNFKKFKTKSTAALERKETVELVLSEENDYGIGNAYWRSTASGSQSYSDTHDITPAHPPLPFSRSKPPSKALRVNSRNRRARAPATDDEDDELVEGLEDDSDGDDRMELDAPAPPPKPPSTRSRAGAKAAKAAASPKTAAKTKTKTTAKARAKGSPARTKRAPATRSATKGKKPALFLSDDEDEDEDGMGGAMDEIDEIDASAAAVAAELGVGEDEDEDTHTFGVGAGERAAADNNDERADAGNVGMTSTLRSTAGTQVRREAVRTAAKRRAVAVAGGDDDDSDDAVFKGFGRRTRKRGRVK